jgi:hypothetical protein
MTLSSTSWRSALLVAAVSLSACSMMPGDPASVPLKAQLDAKQEVPPNGSPGTGSLEGRLDKTTNLLRWKVTYSGLTGPATAGHFHGPASIGQNAGVVVPFTNPASPIEGQQTLTAAQVADLTAGKWYVNIHTAANPGGEIRGQVMVGM